MTVTVLFEDNTTKIINLSKQQTRVSIVRFIKSLCEQENKTFRSMRITCKDYTGFITYKSKEWNDGF